MFMLCIVSKTSTLHTFHCGHSVVYIYFCYMGNSSLSMVKYTSDVIHIYMYECGCDTMF